MTTKEAIEKLKAVLAACDSTNFRAISTILELGAGSFLLEERNLSQVERRKRAEWELTDAVTLASCDQGEQWQPEAEFEPVHGGSWEAVLATLVIEEEWETIERCAKSLEADPHLEHRREMREG